MNKRIVLVCRCYITQRPGGMIHVIADRAVELVARGYEVHVITTQHPTDGPGAGVHDGVHVHYTDGPPQTYCREFSEGCTSLVKQLQPAILHLDSADFRSPWWLDVKADVAGPIGCTLHGFGMGAMLTQWVRFLQDRAKAPDVNWQSMKDEAAALHTFDRVIGIGQHEHGMLRDLYGLQPELVYNPIGTMFFTKDWDKAPADGPLLCVGVSGHSERNFNLAQQAAKLAGVELLVASKVARQEMPAMYDKCRAILLPTSYAQGYDLVVAEGLARARRTLVSSVGSYSREHDFSIPFSVTATAEEIATKIAELTNHHLVFASMLRQRAELYHHPAQHAEKWLEVMQ